MKDKKVLIAEMSYDGIRMITGMKNDSNWHDIREQIENDLDSGSKSISVKFFWRTKEWFDAQPEYDQ